MRKKRAHIPRRNIFHGTSSVHGNIYGTQQEMEEVVQKQMCPCKCLLFGPICLNLRSKCMYCRATHMKCCLAYLNSCLAATTTIINPNSAGGKIAGKMPRNQGVVLLQGGHQTRRDVSSHCSAPLLITMVAVCLKMIFSLENSPNTRRKYKANSTELCAYTNKRKMIKFYHYPRPPPPAPCPAPPPPLGGIVGM